MAALRPLLIAYTPLYRYVVPRDQICEIRLITSQADLDQTGPRSETVVGCALGRLLIPNDALPPPRCHALVPTHHPSIALLINRVDDFSAETTADIQPLAPILAQHLQQSWYLGAVVCDNQPLLVLNLFQIAQDVLLWQQNILPDRVGAPA